jgi:hypothetical protein
MDPLAGEQLFADVCRYESFGVHRYGSPGAVAALDWIADEMRRAGFAVSAQTFTVPRQYDFESGTLEAEGHRLSVMPQWWLPPGEARLRLVASIAPSGSASGRFARLTLPFDRGAYLTDGHRTALDRAFARDPIAVLLTIDHPSDEIFTYNVDQATRPGPRPVVLVAPKDAALVDSVRGPLTLSIEGRHRENVPGRNIVARLDRGKGRWIVVSTPVTSWFTSTGERGPGIAGFLAVARLAAHRFADVDLMFVATAGHEIGHGGMEHFLRHAAPPPAATLAWAHFGATLACHDTIVRFVARSPSLASVTDRHFAAVSGTRLTGRDAAIGEIRDIHGAGYPAFFGMAGAHRFFHTPADSSTATSPQLLAPVIGAFASTLAEIAGVTGI